MPKQVREGANAIRSLNREGAAKSRTWQALLAVCVIIASVPPVGGQPIQDVDGDGLAGKAELRSLAEGNGAAVDLLRIAPVWQRPPGSNLVVYARENAGSLRSELVLTDTAASFSQVLDLGSPVGIPGYPALAPDGSQLWVLDLAQRPHSLYRAVVGGVDAELWFWTAIAPPKVAVSAVRSVCYKRGPSTASPSLPHLYLLDASTGESTVLAQYTGQSEPGAPSITADGAWVYFFDTKSSTFKRVRAKEAGAVEQLLDQNGDPLTRLGTPIDFSFAISGDGSTMVFDRFGELVVYDTATRTETVIASSAQVPDISTDGTTVIFVRGQRYLQSEGELYAIDVDGTDERLLAERAIDPAIQ